MAKNDAGGQHFGKFAAFVGLHLSELSGSAVKVYSALCCLCGYHDRHVHVSYATLMERTGTGSEHTLRKALNDLEAIGAICRKSGNVGKCNDYFLPLEPPAKSAGGMDFDPPQKVPGVTRKKCGYPPAKSAPRTKRSTEKSIQEAQRAQPHGQAGAALADGAAAASATCPACGSLLPEGAPSCPGCGWDTGQLSLADEPALAWEDQAALAAEAMAKLQAGIDERRREEAAAHTAPEHAAALADFLADEPGEGKESEEIASAAFSGAEAVSNPQNGGKGLTEALRDSQGASQTEDGGAMSRIDATELARVQRQLDVLLDGWSGEDCPAGEVAEAVATALDGADLQELTSFDLGIYLPELGGEPVALYHRAEGGWRLHSSGWTQGRDRAVVSAYVDAAGTIWLDCAHVEG